MTVAFTQSYMAAQQERYLKENQKFNKDGSTKEDAILQAKVEPCDFGTLDHGGSAVLRAHIAPDRRQNTVLADRAGRWPQDESEGRSHQTVATPRL